jgi:hypothetical protein
VSSSSDGTTHLWGQKKFSRSQTPPSSVGKSVCVQ